MKCPKCHYLSFEPEPRCRNCGYDLETPGADTVISDPDPLLKDRDAEGPLADYDLRRPPPAESKPAPTLGVMRPDRDVEPIRLSSSYRPPALRQNEQPEGRPGRNLPGVAVAEPSGARPPRPGSPRPEYGRPPQPRPEPVKPVRPDYARAGSPAVDAPRGDAPRVSAPRVDAPRVEVTRVDASRVDASRVDASRVDASRVDASRVDAPPFAPRVEAREVAKRAPNTTTDLPLFLKRLPDPDPVAAGLPAERPVDADLPAEPPVEPPMEVKVEPNLDPIAAEIDRPLVKLPASPRAPLSVRRNAEQPSKKSDAEISFRRDGIDRDLLDDLELREPAGASVPKISRRPESRTGIAEPVAARAAGPVGRSLAAILDGGFLAGVGAAVLWITLRVCGLTMADLPGLPILVALPLAAFVLLIDLGYLLLFTAAGGQTLGKMAARIRVIGTSAQTGNDERLNIQRAAFRSLLALPSVLAFGAGFLPALVGDRRAVHDRIAQTRVVRV